MAATAFIDFAALKQQISIVQVAQMLSLKLKQQGEQYRGPCPACNQGGERALAINSAKASYYCFAEKAGGDAIALCAHITGKSQREAASQIATFHKFVGSDSAQAPDTTPQAPRGRQGFDAEAYLKGLDPASPVLKEIGVTPETLTDWRAGYCKSGVNRGKLAIALCDREGNILGFCGRSLDGSTPSLSFPNGVNAADIIFGADHIQREEVRLLRDPLEVLAAAEVGESAICFLTENVEPQQLEALASLLDAKKARVFF
jgi:hypothetical protein